MWRGRRANDQRPGRQARFHPVTGTGSGTSGRGARWRAAPREGRVRGLQEQAGDFRAGEGRRQRGGQARPRRGSVAGETAERAMVEVVAAGLQRGLFTIAERDHLEALRRAHFRPGRVALGVAHRPREGRHQREGQHREQRDPGGEAAVAAGGIQPSQCINARKRHLADRASEAGAAAGIHRSGRSRSDPSEPPPAPRRPVHPCNKLAATATASR